MEQLLGDRGSALDVTGPIFLLKHLRKKNKKTVNYIKQFQDVQLFDSFLIIVCCRNHTSCFTILVSNAIKKVFFYVLLSIPYCTVYNLVVTFLNQIYYATKLELHTLNYTIR